MCHKNQLVCFAAECEYISLCKEQCIEKCPACDPDAAFLSTFPPEMKSAVNSLQEMIRGLTAKLPREAVIAALLNLAEESVVLALTEKPYELLVTIEIRKWLCDKYGSVDSYKIDRSISEPYKSDIDDLWRCFLAIWVFQEYETRVTSGDAVLALSEEGRELLAKLKNDPTCFVRLQESQLEEALKTKQPPPPGHIWRVLWTRQMVPVLRWCRLNTFPVELRQTSLSGQFREMERAHAVALSEGKLLHPAERVRLSLPFYGSIFHMSRFAALHYKFFTDVIQDYQWLPQFVEEELGFTLDHQIWDGTVLRLKHIFDSAGPLKIVKQKGSQSDLWPIYHGNQLLLASAILLAFAVKNRVDVLATNYEVGPWFEDIVEKELIDRKIPIVARNVEVPGGEIDLVCFNALYWYVIEAKDYGPRGKSGYFSSQEYAERNVSLTQYLENFAKRLQWIKCNPSHLGISADSQIYGIYVSSCEEPHIVPPSNITAVLNRRLCSVFGGEPIDPMLKLEALKVQSHDVGDIPPTKETIRPDTSKRITPSKMPREANRLAMRRIESIFGDLVSFQVYRIAWEVCQAIHSGGFSVMELCADPRGRPQYPTKQYLAFIAHRADGIPLPDIDKAYENIVSRGLLKERDAGIELGNPIATEYWQRKGKDKGKKWKRTKSFEKADLILFSQTIRDMERIGRLATFIDAIYGHPGTLMMFKTWYGEESTSKDSDPGGQDIEGTVTRLR